jgi:hypothetical protein
MGGDYPDYCKKVVVVYEGTVVGGEVLCDHRKILGIALKSPTFAQCLPISVENDALAYDPVADRFKVDVQAMTIGTIDVDVIDRWNRQLGAMDLARVLGAALSHANPVITRLTDGAAFIDPRTIRALTAAELKVDLTTDTLAGLKVLEKNATGIKVDLVTDTLAGLKVLEKNATGIKVDLVTDTLAGLKVLEKNATGIKVDIVTDTLAGLKAIQATRTSLKVQPEREDGISLGGVASPNAAGVKILDASGTTKIKVFDAGFCGAVAGVHYFYFGTSTAPTTRRFCTINTVGAMQKTFVQPRVSNASDALYLYASVSETNMPYDLNYVQE